MASVFIREFPDDLHHKVKVLVAKEKTTLKELVIRLLTEYVQKKGNSHGDPGRMSTMPQEARNQE